jgi:hypothetical protein
VALTAMAKSRKPDVARVIRAAIAAIAAHNKGAAPPPNERDPVRVTAHLGTFKAEAESLPAPRRPTRHHRPRRRFDSEGPNRAGMARRT